MKEKVNNLVDIMGYLRENNLEMVNDPKMGRVIKGSMTVAFDEVSSVRMSVYAPELSSKNTVNKAYTALTSLLPRMTTSVKSALEQNATATFATVKDIVTKIVAHCEFQEYAYKDDSGKVNSRPQIKLLNYRTSIHTPTAGKPFEPGATFMVDAYIESIRPEMKAVAGESAEETGRYLISALTPDFRGMMHRIEYVTEAGSVSEYISQHWRAGESTYLTGVVSNIMKVTKKAGIQAGFGQPAPTTSETTFIDERVVRGGGQTTIDANEDGMEAQGFTSEDIKKGLVLREEAIAKNSDRTKTTGAAPTQATKDFGFGKEPQSTPNSGSAAVGGFGGFNPSEF